MLILPVFARSKFFLQTVDDIVEMKFKINVALRSELNTVETYSGFCNQYNRVFIDLLFDRCL